MTDPAPTFVVRCAHGVLCRRTTCRTTAELVADNLNRRSDAEGPGRADCAPYVVTTEETA